MELSNINVQIKAPSNNDIPVKSSAKKGSESNFTKVYKAASSKNDSDNIQSKIVAMLKGNFSLSDSDKKTEEQTPKDERDLNKLVELLLLSGNTSQNLINLLTSNSNVDKNELKDLIKKMLTDNLLTDTSSKDNALNINLLSLLNNEKVPAQENSSKPEALKDDITKNILSNNSTLDESLTKLSSDIADKLLTDNTFKANVLSSLLDKVQSPIVANDNSLKDLIIKQLKGIVDKTTLISDTDSNNTNAFTNEGIPVKAFKADLSTDLKTEALNVSNNKTVALNSDNIQTIALDDSASKTTPTVFKPTDNSSDKDDLLLKQLLDGDNSKNNKDNISDKIANVINRFETVRIDKPTMTEGNVLINKATFNEDFIKTVKFMDLNNLKELSVKVIPKDLGEIVIRLSMDNGVMKANITATNKDTYNLLNSQLPAISNELSKQNMTIQNFSLSLYNGDNFLFNGDGSSNQNTRQQGKNNIKAQSIEDMDLQNEQYFEDPSSVNILA